MAPLGLASTGGVGPMSFILGFVSGWVARSLWLQIKVKTTVYHLMKDIREAAREGRIL